MDLDSFLDSLPSLQSVRPHRHGYPESTCSAPNCFRSFSTFPYISLNFPSFPFISPFQLLEAVRLHRHGYPEHMLCSEFRRAFEILAPPETRAVVAPLDEVKAVQDLVLKHLELDKNLFKFGLSRIFFRAGE